jgi:hypothetical protein
MEMRCAVHPDREAVGACCSCGSYICEECKVSIGSQLYCNRCVQSRLKTGSWPGQTSIIQPYPSGMGPNTPVPPEIVGWNWGAFLLTWIWGIGNNVWISLIALAGVVPYVGWIASLTMMIILGLRGNEWAWQQKKWESIEHFRKNQRTWMWWGISATAAYIIFVFALTVLLISLIMIARTLGIENNLKGILPWS